MGSCSKGANLGYQLYLLFTPLQALMASREPGGDAFTVAPTGRDFFRLYSRISRLVTLMVNQLSGFVPVSRFYHLSLVP